VLQEAFGLRKGNHMKKRTKPLIARVVLEINISEDIAKKYPNFIFNYEDEKDFLDNLISTFNHNISLEECEVHKNLHPNFEDPNYEICDDGYKQIVKKIEFVK
jgi:hypothetical protein